MNAVDATTESAADFRAFVEEHRARCLWFLAADHFPTTPAEIETVLRLIEQHGDRTSFLRAAAFRRWLSLPSNAGSATS